MGRGRFAYRVVRLAGTMFVISLLLGPAAPPNQVGEGPGWKLKEEDETPCNEGAAWCKWVFDPAMPLPSPPDPTYGLLFQEVKRAAWEIQCAPPYDLILSESVTYYEMWMIRRGKPNEDIFSTVPMSPETEHSDDIVGNSKWIPWSEETDSLIRKLWGDVMENWNSKKNQDGNVNVLDEEGMPIVWKGANVNSGPLPNGNSPPSSGSEEATWENNYGGLAVDVGSHSLTFGAECCFYTGIFSVYHHCE